MMKWTISKKFFIVLLLSFTTINIFNFSMDYVKEKEKFYASLGGEEWDREIYKLSGDFHDHYDEINEDYIELIRKSTYQPNIFLINDQKEIIYDGLNEKNMVLTVEDLLSSYSNNQMQIILDDLEDDKKKQIESYLSKYDGHFLSVSFASPTYDEHMKKHSIYVDDLTYLKIDNQVIFNRLNGENIHNTYFVEYTSQNFYVSRYSFSTNEGVYVLNYQEIKDDVLSQINLNNFSDEYVQPLNYTGYYENNKTVYHIYCQSLIRQSVDYNEFQEYAAADINEYIVLYNYDYYGLDKLMNQVIDNNTLFIQLSCVLVVVLSAILSHLLTKRIINIDKITQKIANNHFNVYLDEKGNDELGVLSHNINKMNRQLKTTIDQLNEELLHAKRLETMRKEFIANFTHEIKTPLSIINGYIELIENTQNEHKKEEYLQAIEHETSHINDLVLAMLNLSRLESGTVELKKNDVDIEDLVSTALDEMSSLLKKKQVKIIMNGKSPVMNIDPFEMEMVIKNFLSNAIKHTPEQGHIYISYTENQVNIENEGSSLTDEQMQSIWDTYVSGDREGTGLGLAICKTILELHDFDYGVNNTEKGVAFWFRYKEKEIVL